MIFAINILKYTMLKITATIKLSREYLKGTFCKLNIHTVGSHIYNTEK